MTSESDIAMSILGHLMLQMGIDGFVITREALIEEREFVETHMLAITLDEAGVIVQLVKSKCEKQH